MKAGCHVQALLYNVGPHAPACTCRFQARLLNNACRLALCQLGSMHARPDIYALCWHPQVDCEVAGMGSVVDCIFKASAKLERCRLLRNSCILRCAPSVCLHVFVSLRMGAFNLALGWAF